ncbi:uncharacterized protein IWZ02DRAFT_298480 [Phyllosticta citriasiana]|uniref:uncharacterized protein n=1 Tax=Phyllosticta citriasiana TaxID=595635 RepID=UPI0030FD3C0C
MMASSRTACPCAFDTGTEAQREQHSVLLLTLDPRSFLLLREFDVGFLVCQRDSYSPLKHKCSGQAPLLNAYGGSLILPSPRPRLNCWHGRSRPGLQTSLIGSRHGGEGGVSGKRRCRQPHHRPCAGDSAWSRHLRRSCLLVARLLFHPFSSACVHLLRDWSPVFPAGPPACLQLTTAVDHGSTSQLLFIQKPWSCVSRPPHSPADCRLHRPTIVLLSDSNPRSLP